MRQAIALIQGDFAGLQIEMRIAVPSIKAASLFSKNPGGFRRAMAILARVMLNACQPGGVTDPGPGFSHNFQLDTSSF
jgi:hypothetical protein